MSKELDQVLGQMEVELDGRVETNTSQETNLGLYNNTGFHTMEWIASIYPSKYIRMYGDIGLLIQNFRLGFHATIHTHSKTEGYGVVLTPLSIGKGHGHLMVESALNS